MSTDSGRVTSNSSTDLLKDQKGSIMLEFVFTVSILMVIFLATVTFSLLFGDYYGAQKVAAEGAREASITNNIESAQAKAMDAAWLWGLDPDRTSIEFYSNSSTVTCTVHYTAKPFNRTFPTLLEGMSLQDYKLSARAEYVLTDTRK